MSRLLRQNSPNVAIKCVLNNMVSYNGRSAAKKHSKTAWILHYSAFANFLGGPGLVLVGCI